MAVVVLLSVLEQKQADMGVATIGAIKAAQDLSATMQDQQNDTNNSKKVRAQGRQAGRQGCTSSGWPGVS